MENIETGLSDKINISLNNIHEEFALNYLSSKASQSLKSIKKPCFKKRDSLDGMLKGVYLSAKEGVMNDWTEQLLNYLPCLTDKRNKCISGKKIKYK